MADTLDDLIKNAVEELEEEYRANGDDRYFEDRLHEIADNAVPVYHRQIIDIGTSDYSLFTDVPELGPAYDGEANALNYLAANIYERVYNALSQRLQELRDEEEEDDDSTL